MQKFAAIHVLGRRLREPKDWWRILPEVVDRRCAPKRWLSLEDLKNNPEVVRDFIGQRLGVSLALLPSTKWTTQLAHLLIGYREGDLTREETKKMFLSLADRIDVRVVPFTMLDACERLLSGLGLFSLSLHFSQLVREKIAHDHRIFGSVETFFRLVLCHLHWGEVDEARRMSEQLGRKTLDLGQAKRLSVIQHYLSLIGGEKLTRGLPSGADASFANILKGRTILVYGPGATSTIGDQLQFDLVVRRATLGNYEFLSAADLAGNKADIVYINPEDVEVLGREEKQKALAALSRYPLVVTKRRALPGLVNSRLGFNMGALFLGGHPHKGTQVIVNLLLHKPQSVHICGMNFFASVIPYRADSLWTGAPGEGGEGGNFYSSHSFASHNLRENFGLVKNLFDAGAVSGDRGFRDVMSLSVAEYVHKIDKIYGEKRL